MVPRYYVLSSSVHRQICTTRLWAREPIPNICGKAFSRDYRPSLVTLIVHKFHYGSNKNQAEMVIFFTHAKKTVSDFFWLKQMILWTNEAPRWSKGSWVSAKEITTCLWLGVSKEMDISSSSILTGEEMIRILKKRDDTNMYKTRSHPYLKPSMYSVTIGQKRILMEVALI